jgi:hypothetical protein
MDDCSRFVKSKVVGTPRPKGTGALGHFIGRVVSGVPGEPPPATSLPSSLKPSATNSRE